MFKKEKKKSQFSKFLFNPRKIPRGGWGLRPSSKTTDIWVRPWDLGLWFSYISLGAVRTATNLSCLLGSSFLSLLAPPSLSQAPPLGTKAVPQCFQATFRMLAVHRYNINTFHPFPCCRGELHPSTGPSTKATTALVLKLRLLSGGCG